MPLTHADLMPTSAALTADPDGALRTASLAWVAAGAHPDWVPVIAGIGAPLGTLGDALARRQGAGEELLPAAERVFSALSLAPREVRVLIVGQDPYPTPGHGMGLSFSAEPDVRPLPRSLVNLRQELRDDLGLDLPEHGSLAAWQGRGVMLLNRTLTVTAGSAGAHAPDGWGNVTDAVVAHLGRLSGAPVGILWGRHAQRLAPLLAGHPLIESAHPSPLSARRGFFGSRPFSRANRELTRLGLDPVDWSLPA